MDTSTFFYSKLLHIFFQIPLEFFITKFILQITEIVSTGLVLHLASKENELTSKKVLTITGIGMLHIIASGFDQFLSNVFGGEGYAHQVSLFKFPKQSLKMPIL